jgi:hypothetical protein
MDEKEDPYTFKNEYSHYLASSGALSAPLGFQN